MNAPGEDRVEEIRQQCIVGTFSHLEDDEWIQACRDLMVAYDEEMAILRLIRQELAVDRGKEDKHMLAVRLMRLIDRLHAPCNVLEAPSPKPPTCGEEYCAYLGDTTRCCMYASAPEGAK